MDYRKFWRSWGGLILLTVELVGFVLENDFIIGTALLLFLTVPCGMKTFNTNPILWSLRQATFLGIASLFYIRYFGLL